jgi:hypothetical protein
MSTSGKPSVNTSNGKPSWIGLESGTSIFTSSTNVTSVKDIPNGITFEPKGQFRGNGKFLPIKLKGQASKEKLDPPSDGTLTVTTTSPTTSTDVPVIYVNDPT